MTMKIKSYAHTSCVVFPTSIVDKCAISPTRSMNTACLDRGIKPKTFAKVVSKADSGAIC